MATDEGAGEPTDSELDRDGAFEAALAALGDSDRPVARFSRPRSSTPATFGVVADPHVSTAESGTWKMYHHTRDRFRETLARMEAADVDCLLVAGDLTRDGEAPDLDWMEAALDETAVPALAVPGNHDVVRFHVDEFADRFTADGAGFPVHRRVGDVDLVGLNTAMAPDADEDGTETEGLVSEDQLDWLERRLPGMDAPVLVSHHNLPGLDAQLGDHRWDPHSPIGNAEELLDVVDDADAGGALHLSGHVHFPALTPHRDVRGLVLPALSSFPQAYLRLEVDSSGTTVYCESVAPDEELRDAYEACFEESARSEAVAAVTARRLEESDLADGRPN